VAGLSELAALRVLNIVRIDSAVARTDPPTATARLINCVFVMMLSPSRLIDTAQLAAQVWIGF
jgi:hypothetical protein